MMNVVTLKGLVSVINEFSTEMRKIEGTGISRAELMSTLRVLGADMSYLGHAPAAAPVAPAARKSTVNAPMPNKAVKPVAPQQRTQQPQKATKVAPQPAPIAPAPAAAPATPAGKKYTVYTDGSFKKGAYGWAFAVYDSNNKLVRSDKGGGTEPELAKTRNIVGELKAVMAAVAWARKNLKNGDQIVIVHDFVGVANWVLGDWQAKTELAKKYVEYMGQFRGCLSFRKVAGHSGVEGNELVDKLAKEAVEAVLSEPAVEEVVPVSQEEAPAPAEEPATAPAPAVEEITLPLEEVPVEEPAAAPAAETAPAPVEEQKAANKGMTTEEFNSQEPDPELKRFHDEMAKIQFDTIESSGDF